MIIWYSAYRRLLRIGRRTRHSYQTKEIQTYLSIGELWLNGRHVSVSIYKMFQCHGINDPFQWIISSRSYHKSNSSLNGIMKLMITFNGEFAIASEDDSVQIIVFVYIFVSVFFSVFAIMSVVFSAVFVFASVFFPGFVFFCIYIRPSIFICICIWSSILLCIWICLCIFSVFV